MEGGTGWKLVSDTWACWVGDPWRLPYGAVGSEEGSGWKYTFGSYLPTDDE